MAAAAHIWYIGRRRAQDGHTALIQTAINGHADCARLLLDAGADKEVKTNVRATCGVFACVASSKWGMLIRKTASCGSMPFEFPFSVFWSTYFDLVLSFFSGADLKSV